MRTIKDLNLCLVLLMAVCGVSCSPKKSDKGIEAIAVTTETVSNEAFNTGTSYVGTVEEESAVAVSFTGMGTVKRVYVDEGEKVRKGSLVAEMDMTQARNALATAKATHKQATDALERMRQLHENQSLADMKWVEVQTRVEQAEAMLQAAEKMLADCRIYAPMDGVVGRKMLNAGETALPSQPVVTVMSIKNLKIKVSIPEREIAQVNDTTSSRISIEAIGNRTIEGGKIEKGVKADALTHTYNIRINIRNTEGDILPGMVAKVELQNNEEMHGVFLPIRAVQQAADGKHFVWTVAGSKAHRCDITMGRTAGDRIEVLSGIKAGDRVITEGYQKVSEGTPVK
ncbi:MAG: efflux RND transporter periplasmic adaptor subunit [Bacteroides sp.]|nr:efflux RND transporter periplasmic adaptor subunit [Bacteroides sp.]MCM1448640.1 efflux RND transporter periplasmic adaptor subunit [Bacteroides sp.]MCM1516361.1 efflux RND transporter periplasmic adaptor subunit [Paraprevotella sp.]